MDDLALVKDCWEDVLLLPVKCDGLTKPSSYNFTVELILDPIIQENRAPINLKKVRKQLYKPWEIELNVIIEGDILGDEKQSQSVLKSSSGLQEEVVFHGSLPHQLGHEGNEALLHHVGVEGCFE